MVNKAEVTISVNVDCPIKGACPHARADVSEDIAKLGQFLVDNYAKLIINDRSVVDNAIRIFTKNDGNANTICASYKKRIADLETLLSAREIEIRAREAETQTANKVCNSHEKRMNERIAELEAERDAAHAHIEDLVSQAFAAEKDRDALKRDLANATTNYEDYREACDQRDKLRSRIDAAVKALDAPRPERSTPAERHAYAALTGNWPEQTRSPTDSEKARADELQQRIDKAKFRISGSKIIFDAALHNELQYILDGRDW